MKVSGIILIVMAVAWMVFGGIRVVRPGLPRSIRPARRLQGALLLLGGVLLIFSAVALVRR